MAYFNDSDGLCAASTTPSEFNSRQFLWPQAIATPEEIYRATPFTFAQPGSSAAPSKSLFGAPSYGIDPFRRPIDPFVTRVYLESGFFTPGSYLDPLRGSYWPTTSQTTQDHPQTLSREVSLGSSQGWETRMPTLTYATDTHHLGFQHDSNAHQFQTNQSDFWSSHQHLVPTDFSFRVNTRGLSYPTQLLTAYCRMLCRIVINPDRR